MTAIRISQETKSSLAKLGSKGDSYEDIIKRLLLESKTFKPKEYSQSPVKDKNPIIHPKNINDDERQRYIEKYQEHMKKISSELDAT